MCEHTNMLKRAEVNLHTQVKYKTFQANWDKCKDKINETKDKRFCSIQEWEELMISFKSQ